MHARAVAAGRDRFHGTSHGVDSQLQGCCRCCLCVARLEKTGSPLKAGDRPKQKKKGGRVSAHRQERPTREVCSEEGREDRPESKIIKTILKEGVWWVCGRGRWACCWDWCASGRRRGAHQTGSAADQDGERNRNETKKSGGEERRGNERQGERQRERERAGSESEGIKGLRAKVESAAADG